MHGVLEYHNGSVRVDYVPASMLDEFWPLAYKYIRLAQRRVDRNISMADVKAKISGGEYVLLLVYVQDKLSAAVIVSVVQHPRRRNLSIDYVGGENLAAWGEPVLKMLTDMAKDRGLDAIEASGRSGWSLLAKRHGWRPVYVRYEMEI